VSALVLTRDERRRLARLADLLIPAGDGMPAASQVDVHDGGADRVAALLAHVVEPVRRALRADMTLEDLRRDDPEAFGALTTLDELSEHDSDRCCKLKTLLVRLRVEALAQS